MYDPVAEATTSWRYQLETHGRRRHLEFNAPWWLQNMETVSGRPKALQDGVYHTLITLRHPAERAE